MLKAAILLIGHFHHLGNLLICILVEITFVLQDLNLVCLRFGCRLELLRVSKFSRRVFHIRFLDLTQHAVKPLLQNAHLFHDAVKFGHILLSQG